MKDNRDISLDWFKGLCMALVMMVHIGGAKICHAGLPVGFCSWANSFKLIGFFVVSGFLLSIKNSTFESLEGRGGHRWRSVMYPYFLFSLLLLLIMPFLNTDNLGSATSYSKAVAINIVTFRGQSTLWFLPVLFISEMAFICVLTLERRLSFSTGVCRFRWPIVVSTGLVLLLHSLLSPLARPFIDEPIGRQIVASWILPWLRAMPAFVAFAAGAVLLPFLIRILKERKPAFAAAGIAFLLLGWLGPVPLA